MTSKIGLFYIFVLVMGVLSIRASEKYFNQKTH